MECFSLNYFVNSAIVFLSGHLPGPEGDAIQLVIFRPARPEPLENQLLSGGSRSSQRIHPPGEFAFQIGSLILVDDPLFRQLVDHRGHFRQFITSFLLYLDLLQVTDCITGSFTVIAVTIPALFSLPYIFFRCLVICHELDIFRTAKVSPYTGNTKKITFFFRPGLTQPIIPADAAG
jgi:hypothetical protein